MYSHGNPRDHIDHSCHRRAFWVLMQAGVRQVLACSTIGAVNKAIQPGDMVVNADIIELSQTPFSLLPGRQSFDCSGKQIVCPRCAAFWPKRPGAIGLPNAASMASNSSWSLPTATGRD